MARADPPQDDAAAAAAGTVAPVEGATPELEGAVPLRLDVEHRTAYRYASPVSLAHHLAHLQPLADAHQQLLAFELETDPQPATLQADVDAFGNVQHLFSVAQPHDAMTVLARGRVQVAPRFGALQAASAPPWEGVAEGLRYHGGAPFEPAVAFALPSPYVPRLRVLRTWALSEFTPRRPLAEAALALMHRLHAEFSYDSDSTEIDTPLARTFERKRGVCQDFAHLLAGALRMLGLPARYVSGYLLTRPAPGTPALVGADASHAWVQVWTPQTPGVPADGWLDLDPTNALVPATSHVRVAVGRDFGDVTPLRGVIRGGGEHTLDVGVTTRVV
jgi:transglutaminase-like putative cysteine protease